MWYVCCGALIFSLVFSHQLQCIPRCIGHELQKERTEKASTHLDLWMVRKKSDMYSWRGYSTLQNVVRMLRKHNRTFPFVAAGYLCYWYWWGLAVTRFSFFRKPSFQISKSTSKTLAINDRKHYSKFPFN